jgi:hypothetical protein
LSKKSKKLSPAGARLEPRTFSITAPRVAIVLSACEFDRGDQTIILNVLVMPGQKKVQKLCPIGARTWDLPHCRRVGYHCASACEFDKADQTTLLNSKFTHDVGLVKYPIHRAPSPHPHINLIHPKNHLACSANRRRRQNLDLTSTLPPPPRSMVK